MLIDYILMDVFTDVPLAGNPLAVIPKADHLSDNYMQKIAREFNLSETVFLLSPASPAHAASIRIFTPFAELVFAGHPTIGAAVHLGLRIRTTAIRLEGKIGLLTCVIERIGKKLGYSRFKLARLPEETGPAPDRADIAETLGLDVAEIGYEDFQPGRFSAGLEFTIVPVRDEAALARIRLERRGWGDVYGEVHGAVYAFLPKTEPGKVDFEARMFEPGLGSGEDPGTGSAVAALIGYLAKNGTAFEGQRSFMVRQGMEMGRPSLIEMQMGYTDDRLTHAAIGGKAVVVGRGQLDLERALPGSGLRAR
ncbi:MAG TPA: PhzF family phenazine biosynthesis protein [Devosia sp.]|nr:PhzF family phenazine biosynthesis protein [Devosia sp.]